MGSFCTFQRDHLAESYFRTNLFDSTILPVLCCVTETWASTAATSKPLAAAHRALSSEVQQPSLAQTYAAAPS